MTKKRTLRIGLVILFVGVLLVVFTNVILEPVVGRYLNREITKINQEKNYILTLDDFDINIFLGRISIEGLSINPKEEFLDSLVNGATAERALEALSVSKVTLSGLSILNYLKNKQIDVKKIVVDQLNFKL